MKKKIFAIICLCLCFMLPLGFVGCSMGDNSKIESQMDKLKTQIANLETKIDTIIEDLDSSNDSEDEENSQITEINSEKDVFKYLESVFNKTQFDADGNLNNLQITITTERQDVSDVSESKVIFGHLETGINFYYEQEEEGYELIVYEDSSNCYEVGINSEGDVNKKLSEGTIKDCVSYYNILNNKEILVVKSYEKNQDGGYRIVLNELHCDEDSSEYLYKEEMTITTNSKHQIQDIKWACYSSTYNATAKEYSEFELMYSQNVNYDYEFSIGEDMLILLSIALNESVQ